MDGKISIDRREVLRYLGVREEDEALRVLIDGCIAQVQAAATPRTVHRIFSLARTPQGTLAVADTVLRLEGRDIARHLEGCGRVVLMAVTLGDRVDRVVRTAQVNDMARAVTLDCCASALVEAVCDDAERTLRAQAAERGEFLTGRYSPGYGDLPLSIQRDFLSVVDAGRRIGLLASSSDLLVPRKSVTALLGLADHPVTGAPAGCGTCALRGKCEFRRRGTVCGSDDSRD